MVNSLFADVAICFDASLSPRGPALALLDSGETLVPDSEEDMTWRLQDSSFLMTLSRDAPELVGKEIAGFVRRFLKKNRLSLGDVSRFAIHPGGPRVIEQALKALGLPSDAAPHSREILRRRGNMSSATLPHIWHAMLQDPDVKNGELILSLAFGPGLTLVANLLRKERRR